MEYGERKIDEMRSTTKTSSWVCRAFLAEKLRAGPSARHVMKRNWYRVNMDGGDCPLALARIEFFTGFSGAVIDPMAWAAWAICGTFRR